MTLALVDTGSATAEGFDADGSLSSSVGTGVATAAGFAAMGIPAPPAASVPDALRLEVVTAAGVQLAPDLPRRNLTFSVEHNGSGTVGFELDLDTLTDGIDDAILDPDNLVRIHYGDQTAHPYGVAEGMLTSAPPVQRDDGSWALPCGGTGSWDVLELGVLYPPAGATGDTREFSYTSGQTGPAWVAAQWARPYGRKVKSSFRWAKRWPRGWPESNAQWIWSSSPEKTSHDGDRQFVGNAFTVATAGHYRFYAAGDDTLRLYVNGALAKVKKAGGWKKATSFTRYLRPGSYVVSATVRNARGGDNKSGFICAVAQLGAHGSRVRWVLRSSTSTFKFKKVPGYFAQAPLPPDGWYAPAVLAAHVDEAAARGVEFHPQIVRTYSYTADSSGSAWTSKGPTEYDIGISGMELGEKVRSLGYDLAMLPGLRLSAWKHRGFDLRERVAIGTPQSVSWSSKAWPRVRTVGVTHHESGWTETAGDAALAAEYGRRELTISGGGVDGDLQADVFASAAMTTATSPEETIEVTIGTADRLPDGTSAPQPFRDFNVADIVSVAGIGQYVPMKVMSISGAEQDDKSVKFTIAGYPV